jgi:hypothetical protein
LPIEVHRSKEHLYLTICKFGFFDQTMMDETGAGACPIGHCQAGQDQANVAGPYQDSRSARVAGSLNAADPSRGDPAQAMRLPSTRE